MDPNKIELENLSKSFEYFKIASEIDSIEEGEKICAALISEKFQDLINACMCSSFRIEWSIIKELRRDFFLFV